MDQAERQNRKKQLQAFIERSQARRAELNQDLATKRAERAESAKKQAAWAKEEVAKEEAQKEEQKAAMTEWKKKEKERKQEVAEML